MTGPVSTEHFRRFCVDSGAVGFGITRLESFSTADALLPTATLAALPSAIAVALPLSASVLDTLETGPNRLYEHHYRQVNFALDRLALSIAAEIESLGGRALPLPASQIVDWNSQRGHLSHKRVAVAAGLGWLGRNNLLVTPDRGARVRLVTVLTDLPLEPGRALAEGCGRCRACIEVCPARAVADEPAGFDHRACYEMLKRFQSERRVSQYICGLCVRVCAGAQRV